MPGHNDPEAHKAQMPPHDVLNLPRRGFSLAQLKHHYKLLAKQLHPDKRPKGMTTEVATQMFQVLTHAYRMLLQQLEAEGSDRQFDELRAGSKSQQQQPEMAAAPEYNPARFNQVFDEHRIRDPTVDSGYESWMQQTTPGQEEPVRDVVDASLYGPQPLVLSNRSCVQYSELGSSGVTDYSRQDGARHSIQYTDYRLAHSTRKLVSDDTLFTKAESREELRSVDVLKMHRERISYTPSPEDERQASTLARLQKQAEMARLDTLSAYDRLIESTHARVTQQLLPATAAKLNGR